MVADNKDAGNSDIKVADNSNLDKSDKDFKSAQVIDVSTAESRAVTLELP